MDTILLAINHKDPLWIAIAFVFGYAASLIRLPPLVGFLVAGFFLKAAGAASGVFLKEAADLGVTLLLFTIGLKLDLRSLIRPEVWGVSTIHMAVVTACLTCIALLLAYVQVPLFSSLTLQQAAYLGFALTFSSTVFAIKIIEALGAGGSRHGQISIGVLITQDIAAVLFMAISAGKMPSSWSLGLLLLIPMQRVFHRILDYTGQGELLTLFGLVLALGGADVFEMVGMKGDLGALAFGMLLTGHSRSEKLARSMTELKNIFLVGFFLSVGMAASPGWAEVITAMILIVLLPVKMAFYFGLFTGFKLRAHDAWQSTWNLGNYSEFGLIVGALLVSSGVLTESWLAVLSIALALSFIITAPMAVKGDRLYARWHAWIQRFERSSRLPADADLDITGITVLVIGMGRLGGAAYHAFGAQFPGQVLGIDINAENVTKYRRQGCYVIRADGTNPDIWFQSAGLARQLNWAILCLPNHQANLAAARRLQEQQASCRIIATTKYPEEVNELKELGVEQVFNIYAEAGRGFANDLKSRWQQPQDPRF
ncbi:MAG: cation:proton antiporter [Leptospiraceae bacterium]|nr:cation:proton antiporter [Leptospiraceae bacterium]